MGSSGSPGTVFPTTNNLRISRRTTYYTMIHCDRCQRWFPHERAYEQHTEDSCSHWICNDCEVDYASEKSLNQHYTNSSKHHYCQECDRHFDDVGAKVQHMRAKHWYCETHNRVRGSHGGIQMT